MAEAALQSHTGVDTADICPAPWLLGLSVGAAPDTRLPLVGVTLSCRAALPAGATPLEPAAGSRCSAGEGQEQEADSDLPPGARLLRGFLPAPPGKE